MDSFSKGLISLDIDGTLTVEMQPIHEEVINYLSHLSEQGWAFIFITGRTFQWGYETLKVLNFPYYLAVQNGAIILEMPSKKIVLKRYLPKVILPELEKICRQHSTGCVIYAGYEHADRCYYRMDDFSNKVLAYLQIRCDAFREKWENVTSFSSLLLPEFPSIKFFGDADFAKQVTKDIEESLELHVPMIKDPFDEKWFVIQATHPKVSKGQALKDLSRLHSFHGKIIAAGDDNNDRSMLELADVKIVMSTAPKDMLEQADIVAPAAAEMGILLGLRQAIKE